MHRFHLTVLLPATLVSHGTAEQALLQPSSTAFPWIYKFASIGDSYSAGLGAGDRLDWSCSRYAQSYPNILHASLLGQNEKRTHQFLSCSGATSAEILEKQTSALEQDLDLLTISAGGNDIGLTPILSSCIYQFYMAADSDCEKSIEDARKAIADETQLYKNISLLVEAATPKMNKTHGVIYLTGYAGFFGVDDTLCDNVTWSVWSSVSSHKQYLQLPLRQALNALVRSVNSVLQRVAQDAGAHVRFIDYDAHIAAARGRYCEAGISEPAPLRAALAFYEWSTVDTGENSTLLRNRTGADVPRGSFESGIAERVGKTLREHPDWEFDSDKGFVKKTAPVLGAEGAVGDAVHWMLPDAWKRVFHLRPEGHAIVARLVVEDLWDRGPGAFAGERKES